MSERLKSIRAEFEEYGEVGLDSTMWLLDTCDALTAELEAIKDIAAQDDADTAIDAVRTLKEYADQIEWGEAYASGAYQSLTDELEAVKAELARVKAESLRVVKVGDAVASDVAHREHNFILHGNMVCWADYSTYRWVQMDGFLVNVSDDEIVQPVRLERWENYDDAD